MYNKQQFYKHVIKNISKTVKQYINEAFDFDSINKQKKPINIHDILPTIFEKIDNGKNLSSIEYDILTSYNSIYIVDDIEELQGLINYIIDDFGNEVNLNWIDVSNVDNMANLFNNSDFNGDISQWDVSNVRNMQGMFKFCPF